MVGKYDEFFDYALEAMKKAVKFGDNKAIQNLLDFGVPLPSTGGVKYKRIEPWSPIFDGYASLAKEAVSIMQNSDHFKKKEYEGKEEFYRKYFAHYKG